MKIFLSAKKDSFWLDVVTQLEQKNITTAYWVGQIASNNTVSKDCFFHEVVDAYQLKNTYPTEIKSFDINKITLSEYYNYMKILDRGDDIGGYSFSMRDRLLKEQLNYWHSVLSNIKPNAIVFSNIPHLLYDYPLYLIAKTLQIKTLIFNVTPFAGWHYLTDSIFSDDNSSNLVSLIEDTKEIQEDFAIQSIRPYEHQNYETPYYMKKQYAYDKKLKAHKRKYLAFAKAVGKKAIIKSGLTKKTTPIDSVPMRSDWRHNFFSFTGESGLISDISYKVIKKRFKNRLHESYLSNCTSSKKIDKIKSYVYVPLHYQPEATTAPGGDLYSDQIYMIEQLRDSLPKDVSIIVKEHYSQFTSALYGFRGRYLDYYKKIKSIDNTYLAPLDYDQKKLILNSLCVATVTGTAGWEAIQYGKYSIVFGEPWYYSHPNAIPFDKMTNNDLSKILMKKEPKDNNMLFLDKFCKSLVKSDIHNYSDNKVERSTFEVSNSILKFLNK